ncbi:hypothetical protein RLW55_03180 [Hyphomicrobium sp. B1]|uniref:hypothetical protein n=1 Tax=Hyphomicrobium sp. B1 TaxID=3075651 RepID=UPI003C2C11DD
MRIRAFLLLAGVVLMGGCSRDARLYPANLQAGSQTLHARFTDSGMGSGPIELAMPDGEVLKGEFTTTDTSNYGFGSAGLWGSTKPHITTASTSAVPGSMPGVANLVGPQGTTAHCEYLVNSLAGSGSGTCTTNKGAEYQLQF